MPPSPLPHVPSLKVLLGRLCENVRKNLVSIHQKKLPPGRWVLEREENHGEQEKKLSQWKQKKPLLLVDHEATEMAVGRLREVHAESEQNLPH